MEFAFMSDPIHDQSSKSTNENTDAARREALAAQFEEDKKRFKMTEEEREVLYRSVRRLFVIEGKMTQEECDEIERQIAAEKSQKDDSKVNEREDGQ